MYPNRSISALFLEKTFGKRGKMVDNGRVEWYSIQALNEGGTKKRKNLAGNPAGRQKGAWQNGLDVLN